MAKRKSEEYRETPEERARLKKAYEISRKEYTLAKVKKMFSKIDEEKLVPFEDVIHEMEQIHKEMTQKKKKKA